MRLEIRSDTPRPVNPRAAATAGPVAVNGDHQLAGSLLLTSPDGDTSTIVVRCGDTIDIAGSPAKVGGLGYDQHGRSHVWLDVAADTADAA
jgi:hypothetical protein